MLVVDASVVLSLILDDETAVIGQGVAIGLVDHGAIAPTLMWYEVRNALISNERRGRHTKEQSASFLSEILSLPIRLVAPTETERILELARKHGLSVYDASYLDLAMSAGTELVSFDGKLILAAQAEGVGCWGNSLTTYDHSNNDAQIWR